MVSCFNRRFGTTYLYHVQASSLNMGPIILTASSDTQHPPKRRPMAEMPTRHLLYTQTGRCLSICADISGANQKNKQCRSCGVIAAFRVQHATSAFQLNVRWHSCRWPTTLAILSNRHSASRLCMHRATAAVSLAEQMESRCWPSPYSD